MGNAALYFDPADVEDIKGCMSQILNEDLRTELIRSAHDQMCTSGYSVRNSVWQLQDILLKVKPIRKAWGV